MDPMGMGLFYKFSLQPLRWSRTSRYLHILVNFNVLRVSEVVMISPALYDDDDEIWLEWAGRAETKITKSADSDIHQS